MGFWKYFRCFLSRFFFGFVEFDIVFFRIFRWKEEVNLFLVHRYLTDLLIKTIASIQGALQIEDGNDKLLAAMHQLLFSLQ